MNRGPLGCDRIGGADDLHAQSRIVAEFPDDAAAHLEALAVVARHLDQSARVAAQERLEFAVHLGLVDAPAARVGEAELDERVRIAPGLLQGVGAPPREAGAGRERTEEMASWSSSLDCRSRKQRS